MARQVSILLIEDDDVDAEVVSRAFSQERIANPVFRARDGQEALEMLRSPGRVPAPRVLLLDINMPRMDGHEFLVALREDSTLENEVVFVLTTSSDEADIFDAYKRNVAGYIVKEKAGEGFHRVVALLGHYWQVVELPR